MKERPRVADRGRADRRPNVVLVTTHDTGRHFGCYGVETVNTPALDGLAASGCLFTDYFALCPVCSPSRGAAMTGRYPQSNGLLGLVHNPWLWEMNDSEKHLAEILRSHGYLSVLFNVQHESKDWRRCGFEARRDCKRGPETRATCIDTAEEFRRFLDSRANDSRPFYAQIGFFETHTPHGFGGAAADTGRGVHVPPRLVRNEAAEAHMALLQGSVRRVDRAMGMILEGLEEHHLAENTLVVFTTDHGIEAARDKWFLFDPGVGIALVMRWPGGRTSKRSGLAPEGRTSKRSGLAPEGRTSKRSGLAPGGRTSKRSGLAPEGGVCSTGGLRRPCTPPPTRPTGHDIGGAAVSRSRDITGGAAASQSRHITGGKVFDQLLSNVDLAPTILDLLELPVPENMQGESFARVFSEPEGYSGRDVVYGLFEGTDCRSVRTRRHKLIAHFKAHRELVVPVDITAKRTLFNSSPVFQLYDLEKDPLEFDNLADVPAHAEIRQDLTARLWGWMESVGDPLLSGPTRTPYYEAAIEHYRKWRGA